MMTDPIADMLTRIRNAAAVRHETVAVPYSRLKMEIAEILKNSGYILDCAKSSAETGELKGLEIKISLKYQGKTPAITDLKRISKPGRRVYAKKDQMPVVLNNLGVAIISTSRGLMTNKEAKKAGLGGEIICEIY
ncbi:MAG: 30S ribosomal protein S8 [Patescibacteria group bacterium]|jgi:small subunit ribosomal protein S8